jgi:3-hexulose-6-phosphate synthase/6-phospho-3-hexuloisomerase
VGGFIIRSADVEGNTGKVRKAIDSAGQSEYKKKTMDEEMRELFMEVSTSNISDAMHRAPGCRGIKPLAQGQKIAGPAVTVATYEGDWAKPVEATDVAGKGEVIVIYNGSDDVAPWGELASHGCMQKGIAGVVIDGAIRDSDDITEMGFPAWASAVTPNAGDPKGLGEINVDIKCGGIDVSPGDWIIADDMGVMVVPRERAYEIARRAMEVRKMEDRVRVEISRGKTLAQVVDLYKWEKK